VLAGLIALSCDRSQPESQTLSGEVRIAGSSTVYPVATAVAEEFTKMYPEVRVPISSTGTGGGFANFFIPGKTDINDASRPIKQSELDKCRQAGIEPIELKVAIDALTVVANKEAGWASKMTVAELARIWGPDDPPKKWSEVRPGWPDEEFELYGAASTSGTFDYFTENIVGEEDAHRSDYHATEHDNVIVQGVAGNKYALGYFGFAYYAQNKDKLQAVAIDAGDGPVEPSLENAQSGQYKPLSRPLFIYVNRDSLRRPEVKAYVEYFIRKSATNLVSDVGYVPVTERTVRENLAKIGVDR